MSTVVISDTSCLIALDRIDRLDIPQRLFQQIATTTAVEEEFGKKLPEWIRIHGVQNISKMQELETVLDRGEASAITLALETEQCRLIIDEKKGRKVAQSLAIEIMGTLRVIQLAKQNRIVESTQTIIEELQQAGFRFSPKIVKKLLDSD